MGATGAGKWGWRHPHARFDTAVALGGADASQHMGPNAGDVGSDRTLSIPARLAYMPRDLMDVSAGQFDSRVPGRTDGDPEDHDIEVPHDVDTGTMGVRWQRPGRSTAGLTFATPRVEIEPVNHAGSTLAVLRGTNGLAVNNPDGFPLGHRITRFVNRTVKPPRVVHHDRPVPDHRAAQPIVSDSPGGTRTSANPWGVSARRRMMQVPMTRTAPPAPLTKSAVPDVTPWATDFVSGY